MIDDAHNKIDSSRNDYFIAQLMALASQGISDVKLVVGDPIWFKSQGAWQRHTDAPLDGAQVRGIAHHVLNTERYDSLLAAFESDGSFEYEGMSFRVNAAFARRKMMLTFRSIPGTPPRLSELGFINAKRVIRTLEGFMLMPRGLVLVTGPTGSGKSTTLAAMIRFYNERMPGNVITIEDPVEFVHESQKATISQREVGSDTKSFQNAMRGILRQAPNVILLGEIRDAESLTYALQAAESGHVVLATLHTASAPGAVSRIVDMVETAKADIVRAGLQAGLRGVVAQQLVRTTVDGMPRRQIVAEIMQVDQSMAAFMKEPGVRNMNIINEMSTKHDIQLRMVTQLAQGVLEDRFDMETAREMLESADEARELENELKRLRQAGAFERGAQVGMQGGEMVPPPEVDAPLAEGRRRF